MSEDINTDKELKAEEAPADEAKKKHRAEALQWLDYAEGDAAVAHHLWRKSLWHPEGWREFPLL